MPQLISDIRLALRGLSRAPTFTAVVLLTLAIGIGATTAIFSVVNQVMLRPLAVRDPGSLFMLWESNDERGWNQVQVAPANAMDWSEQVPSFERVALVDDNPRSVALATGEGSVPAAMGRVSSNVFQVLGVSAALGRTFAEEEWGAASPAVAVLSHAAWTRHFGADRAIVGRTIRLDGVPHQVIGVMPASFVYPMNEAEIWTTYRWNAGWRGETWFRRAHVLRAIARLRPGASEAQAARELAAAAARLETAYPETNAGMRAGLSPLQRYLVGDRRGPLLLLLGAVGLLQLIVCVNVANLLMARAQARRQEMAVRSALGAGAARIARQVLTESAVLAAIGSVAGLMLAAFGLDALNALRPAELPALSFHLDWRLAGFCLAVAAGSALLFGLQPALASGRVNIQRQLNDAGRGASAGRRGLLGSHVLAAVQVALAVVLLAGAALMLRSIQQLRNVDTGVNMAGVTTFEIAPPGGIYPTDEAKAGVARRLLERIEALPGVLHAGAGRSLPLSGLGWSSDFTIEGWEAGTFGVEVRHREVTSGYFRALEIPLRDGEIFADDMRPGLPDVVVNQAFAERYFPGASPVGRRITFDRVPDSTSTWYRITGVVGNERMVLNADPQPEVIAQLAADTPSRMRFVVKSAGGASLVPAIRAALLALDPEIPLQSVRSMDVVALDALAADRYVLVLFAVFALVALALAATGVYGVAAHAARARTREIGIRMAFGASNRDVLATLMRRGMVFVLAGAAAGLAGSLLGGRAIRTLLFEVEPTDPLALGGAALVLVAVAMVAILVPAGRATRLDPAKVLSAE